jgi:hypothetical protein
MRGVSTDSDVTDYKPGDRVAWADGPHRRAGEGVIAELRPPSLDGRPRAMVSVFDRGSETGETLELSADLLYPVPRWRHEMDVDERRRYHGGTAVGWSEPPGDTSA